MMMDRSGPRKRGRKFSAPDIPGDTVSRSDPSNRKRLTRRNPASPTHRVSPCIPNVDMNENSPGPAPCRPIELRYAPVASKVSISDGPATNTSPRAVSARANVGIRIGASRVSRVLTATRVAVGNSCSDGTFWADTEATPRRMVTHGTTANRALTNAFAHALSGDAAATSTEVRASASAGPRRPPRSSAASSRAGRSGPSPSPRTGSGTWDRRGLPPAPACS